MFASIFKAITSLLLVGVLFFLVTKKELTLQPKIKVTPKKEQQEVEQLLPPQEVPTLEAATTSEKISTEQSTTSRIEPALKKEAEKVTIKVDPKNNLYIPMEEGQSDTDSTYRPLISPCKETMGYRIGRFDTNFGISKAAFIKEIDESSSLWGTPVGKTLFRYNESGPLTINLIYDERQAKTEDVNNLALEIDNAKNTAEALKKTYEQEKAIYLGDGEQLTKDSELFKDRYQTYTDNVTMYNKQGGASQVEYTKMTKELEELKRISQDLTTRRDALLVYMEKINSKVTRYNELVVYINTLIKKSNSLGARKFTEGRFVPSSNTIDIYQYNDLIKLRRVITHELGHVLGINHTESMQSIMYAVNSGASTTLSTDDIKALRAVCP